MSPFLFLLEEQRQIAQMMGDDDYFSLALQKAREGLGKTWPNPAVGCVIVKDGVILAQARTQDSGRPHAESTALAQLKGGTQGACMYVTLEPCSHTGLTSPCVEAIIASGVSRVVYGACDPDERVNGQGIARLKAAEIKVERIQNPQLQQEAVAQISAFSCNKLKKRPLIVAKIAVSADGKIATQAGVQSQITGQKAQELVHSLRACCDAVMVGAETVIIDDPQLNVRLGTREGNPWKIVVDSQLKTNPHSRVYAGKSVVLHCDAASNSQKQAFDAAGIQRVETEPLNSRVDLRTALHKLGDLGLTSILVEGGALLLHTLRHLDLIDDLWLLRSPKIIGPQGVDAWLPDGKTPEFMPNPVAQKLEEDYLLVAELKKTTSGG